MRTIKKRRIEIIAFKRERVVSQPVSMLCPVCHLSSEMLTVRQAGAIAQVKAESIRRWLARDQVHGVRTGGGHYRVCSTSLFIVAKPNPGDSPGVGNGVGPVEKINYFPA